MVILMKRISIRDYHESMGTLIDLSDPITYEKRKRPGSINLTYDKLMLHYQTFLKKGEPYFILCTKGIHSKRAVAILEYYGYNVTQVSMEED
jgi:rhodanese-related sulfurtransferase